MKPFARRKRLYRELNSRWMDATTQKDRAGNATTREYWFGKQTAYMDAMRIVKGGR